MKKIKYQLFFKDSHYCLKDINKNIIHKTITFRAMYNFIKENNLDFSSISLPRLTLSSFFRDFAYFEETEDIKI